MKQGATKKGEESSAATDDKRDSATQTAGVVVALCAGHRCAALGPSVWLGGLDQRGHLQALAQWVEHWQPVSGRTSRLPQDLNRAIIGSGLPIRLATSPSAMH
ncbi:hypothetical protein [Arthrobacter sp. Leaf234]|uniref:hypothetical protein n=1 Tax=Arthrobacter sp. Leaf234 TaxID=1736303 RepID=UPI000AAE6AB3|nr:hypothetical protein [Arthrobacter sp. Leaf234]